MEMFYGKNLSFVIEFIAYFTIGTAILLQLNERFIKLHYLWWVNTIIVQQMSQHMFPTLK
jgi:hypothetical protein